MLKFYRPTFTAGKMKIQDIEYENGQPVLDEQGNPKTKDIIITPGDMDKSLQFNDESKVRQKHKAFLCTDQEYNTKKQKRKDGKGKPKNK